MNLNQLTIRQAQQGLRKKTFSASELTRAYLEQIKKSQLNAFITVTEDQALKQAQEIDQRLNQGLKLPDLAGLPFSLKDVFCTAGIKTTAASKILTDYVPPFNATTTQKLLEQQAVLLGKTNTDEFTMGVSTEYSAFGPTKNPFDPARVAGGSSGGSAAAVASGLSLFSLGTDTGGSVRQPASFCGVVGLKPTYGRISRYGVISMASSFDTVGILSKTVEDAAIILSQVAGQDPKDATTAKSSVPNYLQIIAEQTDEKKPLKGWRLGIAKEYFIDGLDKKVEKEIKKAIKQLEDLGAELVDISLPHTDYALATYYILCPSEVSSNMARYDGVRYGLRNEADDVIKTYFQTRDQGFGPEVKRRIMIGTYALSAGYQDQYYKRAQKVRTLVIEDFTKAFKRVDCIVCPTAPNVAFKIGEKISDPLQMYLQDIFTVAGNVAGIPGISIPVGQVKPDDGDKEMPVGLQILGPHLAEEKVLKVAYEYERMTKK